MEPPNGHPCPECGAPRQRDNTPTCACTHRAAEALRDARTTEAAAAEDFDPLRIRPYVEIETGQAPEGQASAGQLAEEQASAGQFTEGRTPDGQFTEGRTLDGRFSEGRTPDGRLPEGQLPDGLLPEGQLPEGQTSGATPQQRGIDQAAGPSTAAAPARATAADATAPVPQAEAARPGSAAPPVSPADVTAPLPAVDPGATAVLPPVPALSDTSAAAVGPAAPAASAVPAPLTSATSEPSVTDLRMFDGTAGTAHGAPEPRESGTRRPRRRSTLLVAAAGACVAVVAAAGYATGLFSYESPSRDTALPDDIRASVPDAPSSSAAPTGPEGSATAVEPAPAAPRPSPSRSTSPSASPSPSAPSASASPSQSPSPSAPRTSPPATGGDQAPPENSRQKGGPTVLRLGDRGAEVVELQLRLRQLNLYIDDADGTFDDRVEGAVRTYQWSRGVQTDDLGVYDAETRTKLESETREP
ncbi:peptidoglycan-binding protein [Streptomyces sp. NPDC059696]|uniref:peptidoglycan-binding domain-containing protein n=1 Tax=Streptomyces sp. NPDC059696 TaxID=3346911 RepID=UPI003684A860